MQAKLIPLSGGDPIVISRDVTLVGRKPGLCDVLVDRSSVSKIHCLIVRTDGLLFVRDLGSTNGTKVNGQRVTRGALLPGDELAFAGAKYRVFLGPAVPEDSAPPSEATERLSDGPGGRTFSGRLPVEAGADDDSIEIEEGEQLAPSDGDPPSDSDVRLLPDDSAESRE